MSVSMTEAAARHVNRYLSKRGKGVGVRLGVKTTGCSGLAYKLEYVDELAPEDFKFNNPNERDRCGCGESFRV
jgi:iron-sulfur cluster assembly protein